MLRVAEAEVTNFFTDNRDLQYRFENLDLARVLELHEDSYAEAGVYPWAPRDLDGARDNYRRVLELVGDLAGDFIAPRAESVDREGASYADGVVCYAPGTQETLERLRQADLMGITLPRRFGGLDFPVTILAMVLEVVSRADASLMTIFGLQDIAETINRFASEEIKAAFLPRFARGEVTGSMALTEPEAGSDLQNVQLRATPGEDGRWYLNGMKRFITNGCGEISLVLARSEEGTSDARGLSMFVYERDEHMRIRRIEDKMGIHGSPTCELQFTNAPALLVGERRRGLTTYVMSLMNGARLAIAAQAQGIAEAAYRAAEKYAEERIQFGQPIRTFTPVAAMLADMRVAVEAARALLYETALIVDMRDALERQTEMHPEKASEFRADLRTYTRYAGLFTPLAKALCTEMANRVAYDALQIHGGPGYMRDFPVERYMRDARITNIYEGTTQLQVVAAIGGILSGLLAERLDQYETWGFSRTPALIEKVRLVRAALLASVAHVRDVADTRFRDFHARRLVDMTNDVVCGYLMTRDAQTDPRRLLAAEYFVSGMMHRVQAAAAAVLKSRVEDLDTLAALGSE